MLGVIACGPGAPDEPTSTGRSHSAVVPAERQDAMFVRRVREMAELPDRARVELLFLGDSITQGWEDAGRFTWNRYYASHRPANFGIDGDRTQNVLWRLRSGGLDGLSPRLVVLLIGTNNSRSNTAAEVVEGIEVILGELRERLPASKVLLLALFPKHPLPDHSVRRGVDAINALLPALADGERVHFLDIGNVFLTSDGRLEREVMPDYLHLSPTGFKLWAQAMEPTLAALLSED
jgi:beta-glucosidase